MVSLQGGEERGKETGESLYKGALHLASILRNYGAPASCSPVCVLSIDKEEICPIIGPLARILHAKARSRLLTSRRNAAIPLALGLPSLPSSLPCVNASQPNSSV